MQGLVILVAVLAVLGGVGLGLLHCFNCGGQSWGQGQMGQGIPIGRMGHIIVGFSEDVIETLKSRLVKHFVLGPLLHIGKRKLLIFHYEPLVYLVDSVRFLS